MQQNFDILKFIQTQYNTDEDFQKSLIADLTANQINTVEEIVVFLEKSSSNPDTALTVHQSLKILQKDIEESLAGSDQQPKSSQDQRNTSIQYQNHQLEGLDHSQIENVPNVDLDKVLSPQNLKEQNILDFTSMESKNDELTIKSLIDPSQLIIDQSLEINQSEISNLISNQQQVLTSQDLNDQQIYNNNYNNNENQTQQQNQNERIPDQINDDKKYNKAQDETQEFETQLTQYTSEKHKEEEEEKTSIISADECYMNDVKGHQYNQYESVLIDTSVTIIDTSTSMIDASFTMIDTTSTLLDPPSTTHQQNDLIDPSNQQNETQVIDEDDPHRQSIEVKTIEDYYKKVIKKDFVNPYSYDIENTVKQELDKYMDSNDYEKIEEYLNNSGNPQLTNQYLNYLKLNNISLYEEFLKDSKIFEDEKEFVSQKKNLETKAKAKRNLPQCEEIVYSFVDKDIHKSYKLYFILTSKKLEILDPQEYQYIQQNKEDVQKLIEDLQDIDQDTKDIFLGNLESIDDLIQEVFNLYKENESAARNILEIVKKLSFLTYQKIIQKERMTLFLDQFKGLQKQEIKKIENFIDSLYEQILDDAMSQAEEIFLLKSDISLNFIKQLEMYYPDFYSSVSKDQVILAKSSDCVKQSVEKFVKNLLYTEDEFEQNKSKIAKLNKNQMLELLVEIKNQDSQTFK
eukprot:403349246